MTSPYRVPSPPEAEAPEADHPYEEVLRRQRRRTRLSVAGALLAATIGLVAFARERAATAEARRAEVRARVTEAERERITTIRQSIDAARSRAHEAEAQFTRGIEEARAKGDDALATCAHGTAAPASAAGNVARLGSRRFVLSVVEEAAHGVPSRVVDEVLADARRAEIHLEAGRYEDASAYALALSSPARLGRELVVIAKKATPPQMTSLTSYVPGEVEGRAYLWDFREARVLCAADVHATSSREIGFTYAGAPDAKAESGRTTRLVETLEGDLSNAVERAATDALFATR